MIIAPATLESDGIGSAEFASRQNHSAGDLKPVPAIRLRALPVAGLHGGFDRLPADGAWVCVDSL
jgi:hypothetical protein